MIEAVRPFTIYGLRLKGSKEVRYVGQTAIDPQWRLHTHITAAHGKPENGWNRNSELGEWLRDYDGDVEAFKIAYVDTRKEAFAMERAIIALCVRLEHRLFNKRSGAGSELMGDFLTRRQAPPG